MKMGDQLGGYGTSSGSGGGGQPCGICQQQWRL